jgi:hypothetical protein
MNKKDTSVWREHMSRMNKDAIIEVVSGIIEIRDVYHAWYWEHKNRNHALQAIADDAVRELERILKTGDTYGTKEIVENYKEILAATKPIPSVKPDK